jgi:conjugative relaxase-like TrwC/TraI family protein
MLTMSDEITTSEHRTAWDATISAPKTVSLAALVGGDGRIRDAYRESINETVKELEKYLQARLEEGQRFNPGFTTGNDHEGEDKNETKTATPTSSLMTFRSMNL